MKYSDIAMPDFYQDEYYKKGQEQLFPFYSQMLEGKMPDYYKPIGEYGGKEFEDVMGMTTRDITQRGLESGARMGMRGPRVSAGISRAVGDTSKSMRYADYSRAIEGRGGLLSTATKGMEGVRGAGLDLSGMKNSFNIQKTGLEMNLAKADEAKKKAKADRWAQIIKSGLGVLGTAAGFAMNPASAATNTIARGAAGGATPTASAALDIGNYGGGNSNLISGDMSKYYH